MVYIVTPALASPIVDSGSEMPTTFVHGAVNPIDGELD